MGDPSPDPMVVYPARQWNYNGPDVPSKNGDISQEAGQLYVDGEPVTMVELGSPIGEYTDIELGHIVGMVRGLRAQGLG